MKKLLFINTNSDDDNPLLKEIIFCYANNLFISTIDNVNSLLMELRTSEISCLIFDDINLGRKQIFSREETNDNRTTVLVLIKTLSQNKKFDPRKIVVKISRPGRYFEKYRTDLFEQWKNELISYGVLAENIFEKPANNKKVAEVVVKILNN